jgi:hypothetical protein
MPSVATRRSDSHSPLGYTSPVKFEEEHARQMAS